MTDAIPPTTPAEKLIRDPRFLRAHFLSARETMPTRRVWRGPGPARELPAAPQNLAPLRMPGGESLEQFLAASESSALLVLHRGAVVHEQYLHGMRAHDVHVTASMTKSLVGLVASMLIRDGVLERSRRLEHYVPELAGTGFGESTVDHLLHMGTAVRYEGRPFHKEAEAQRFFAAVGIAPRPEGYDGPRNLLERLAGAEAERESGSIFRYENGNTEALAEAIRAVTGTPLAQLLSETVWSGVGATEDGHFDLDPTGREIACGRFSATLRDLARLGELLRCGGAWGGRQVLPEDLVAGIATVPEGPAADVLGQGDSRIAVSPVLAYHDFWWLPYGHEGAFEARGRSGQRLYVSPARELVVAHFGAHAVAPSVPVPQFDAVFQQIARELSPAQQASR